MTTPKKKAKFKIINGYACRASPNFRWVFIQNLDPEFNRRNGYEVHKAELKIKL